MFLLLNHDCEDYSKNFSARLLNLYSCCVVVGDALHNPKVSFGTDALLLLSNEHLMNSIEELE